MTEPLPGVFVFDLGQNISGVARLEAEGPAGTRITLRYGERLNPDGTLYTLNLRKARATDVFILRGEGREVFQPRFTYHGFQYVELTGYPGRPDREAVEGVVLTSSLPAAGSFHCSSDLVNRLFENIVWGQRGNYLSVPTDCPQRDERLGWMGDAQIFIRTGTFNMDAAAFFTKWMRDVADAQSAEGAFPDFAPRVRDRELMRFEAAPAWADAGVIIPWTLYRVYGDTRIIEEHWDAMEKWMTYLDRTNPDGLRRRNLGNNYGDWLNVQAPTPKDLLATAYWAHDARIMAEMADAIGRRERAAAYRESFRRIREAFQAEYIAADGRIAGGSQTAYLLGLHMDLFPDSLREAAAEFLVEDIREHGTHLSTGFVGGGYLHPVLSETGHSDVAYALLLNTTFPSWGYTIRHGATTIWERWDGWTEEKGFQNPGMNSFNHYAFGAVGEWLYRCSAGIDLDPEVPGYKKIRIRPQPGEGLDYARAEFHSIHGKIISGWKRESARLEIAVTIPPNTTAEVWLPWESPEEIMEGERSVMDSEAIRFIRIRDQSSIFFVESGEYVFFCPCRIRRKLLHPAPGERGVLISFRGVGIGTAEAGQGIRGENPDHGRRGHGDQESEESHEMREEENGEDHSHRMQTDPVSHDSGREKVSLQNLDALDNDDDLEAADQGIRAEQPDQDTDAEGDEQPHVGNDVEDAGDQAQDERVADSEEHEEGSREQRHDRADDELPPEESPDDLIDPADIVQGRFPGRGRNQAADIGLDAPEILEQIEKKHRNQDQVEQLTDEAGQ